MLKSLIIKNIVLIEKLKLNYDARFSVFSGETGAGKSIILSSLGLAIGMRADFSLIRKGESEGVVIAEFEVNKEHFFMGGINENAPLRIYDLEGNIYGSAPNIDYAREFCKFY